MRAEEMRNRLIGYLSEMGVTLTGVVVLGSSMAVGIPLIVAGVGGIAVETFRLSRAVNQSLTIHRILVDKACNDPDEVFREIDQDTLLLFALFFEGGRLTYGLIGHRDPQRSEELRRNGALITMEEAYRRADHGIVELAGF